MKPSSQWIIWYIRTDLIPLHKSAVTLLAKAIGFTISMMFTPSVFATLLVAPFFFLLRSFPCLIAPVAFRLLVCFVLLVTPVSRLWAVVPKVFDRLMQLPIGSIQVPVVLPLTFGLGRGRPRQDQESAEYRCRQRRLAEQRFHYAPMKLHHILPEGVARTGIGLRPVLMA